MRRTPILLLCALLLTGSFPGVTGAAQDDPPRRPGVTLVLSGGGARGAAHIGVLKVLEEMRVPVDLVVGTSMGSIVGGLYATGWSPSEIEKVMAGIDFGTVFVDHSARDDESFHRKQDDLEFLIPFKLRFDKWKPHVAPSFLGGQKLEILLRTLEIESTGSGDFDAFPIPYRAVAADLATGEAVILGEGSLATAMRASMSVAGMFAPVIVDGRRLVDGGAAANLPIGIARDLRAGAIIAVDITSPLLEEDELRSVLSVIDQMSTFLTVGNRREDVARLQPGDLLIVPELDEIGFADFDRSLEAVGLGEVAARKVAEELRAFSVSEDEYAAFQRRPAAELLVDEVRINNDSWVDDELVRRQVRVPVGMPLDQDTLRDDVLRLHALDYFGTIRHRFERGDGIGGAGVLTLDLPGKRYGRNSLQFGINFRDDFEGDTGYAVSIRHQRLAVNGHGGEWQNIGQIGETSLLQSEFYQPLDYGMRWFVAPALELRRETQNLWVDGERVTEFRIGTSEARLDAGRVFGNWGEIRVGAFHAKQTGEPQIGPAIIPDYSRRDGGIRLGFSVDTLDDLVFPERGMRLAARYEHSLETLGANADDRRVTFLARGAMTRGKHTFAPGVELGSIRPGATTLHNAFQLGGLLRLSGLGTNELLGDRLALGTIVYYRELAEFDLGSLSPRVYAGASFETGNTYFRDEPITTDSLRYAGSVFVGARTPIGPVYLAYGLAEGGRSHVYLNIGTRF